MVNGIANRSSWGGAAEKVNGCKLANFRLFYLFKASFAHKGYNLSPECVCLSVCAFRFRYPERENSSWCQGLKLFPFRVTGNSVAFLAIRHSRKKFLNQISSSPTQVRLAYPLVWSTSGEWTAEWRSSHASNYLWPPCDHWDHFTFWQGTWGVRVWGPAFFWMSINVKEKQFSVALDRTFNFTSNKARCCYIKPISTLNGPHFIVPWLPPRCCSTIWFFGN